MQGPARSVDLINLADSNRKLLSEVKVLPRGIPHPSLDTLPVELSSSVGVSSVSRKREGVSVRFHQNKLDEGLMDDLSSL